MKVKNLLSGVLAAALTFSLGVSSFADLDKDHQNLVDIMDATFDQTAYHGDGTETVSKVDSQ